MGRFNNASVNNFNNRLVGIEFQRKVPIATNGNNRLCSVTGARGPSAIASEFYLPYRGTVLRVSVDSFFTRDRKSSDSKRDETLEIQIEGLLPTSRVDFSLFSLVRQHCC